MARYKRIMLVDDNEIDNIINEKIIESNDFADHILTCTTGQEALDYLAAHQDDDSDLPDIIFLDINMPVMDGFQFLEEFANLSELVHKTCNIIMLSSSLSPRDIDRAASSIYVKTYLNKPLNARYLNGINL